MATEKLRKQIEANLAKLDGPEWDSGDEGEEDVVNLEEGEEVKEKCEKGGGGATKSSKKKKKKKSAANDAGSGSRVVYLGHIPHGFYEEGISGFFSQFGGLRRSRLSRSIKTGRSKGYAFLEFEDPEVAAIVAETMNGYYLYDKQLVCSLVPQDKIHPRMFVGAGKRLKAISFHTIHREEFNREKTEEEEKKHSQNVIRKEKKKRKRLEALGYTFPDKHSAKTEPQETKSKKKEVSASSTRKATTQATNATTVSTSKKSTSVKTPSKTKTGSGATRTAKEPPKAQTAIKKQQIKKRKGSV